MEPGGEYRVFTTKSMASKLAGSDLSSYLLVLNVILVLSPVLFGPCWGVREVGAQVTTIRHRP